MSNPFQIQFTLRQHTPMIHFQHDQDGATLRATEVKPKLDRFIKSKIDKIVWEKWLIGDGSQEALDYKIRFITFDKPKPTSINGFPCFFADMGDDWENNPKKFIKHTDKLIVQINSNLPILIDTIRNNFNAFISQTNFGMRQSKGFGSFYINEKRIEGAFASFKVTRDNSDNCRGLFESIDLFYKSLRGGVRDYKGGPPSKFYFKSLIVAYYHKNAPTPRPLWDKEAIKQVIIGGGNSSNNIDIKDLIGFSTTETWGEKLIEKHDILDDPEVLRFASPITFKPIYNEKSNDWTVYLFPKEIPDTYKKTTISASYNGRNVNLKMWDSFDLKAFLGFIESMNDENNFYQHIEDYDKNGEFDRFVKHSDCIHLKRLFSTYKLL